MEEIGEVTALEAEGVPAAGGSGETKAAPSARADPVYVPDAGKRSLISRALNVRH